MSENKTKATEGGAEEYIAGIADKSRQKDCEALVKLMTKVTKQKPKIWGTSIVGFGSYHYRYESGREGDSCLVGFSSRKGDISVYGLASSPDHGEPSAGIGKHKMGKGCLYIRKLSDIDLNVLEQLVAGSFAERKRQYGQTHSGT